MSNYQKYLKYKHKYLELKYGGEYTNDEILEKMKMEGFEVVELNTEKNRDMYLNYIGLFQKTLISDIKDLIETNLIKKNTTLAMNFTGIEEYKDEIINFFKDKINAYNDATNRLIERIGYSNYYKIFLIVKKDGKNIDYIVSSTIDIANNKFIYHIGINRLPSYIIQKIISKSPIEKNLSMKLHAFSILYFTQKYKHMYDLLVVPLEKMGEIIKLSNIEYITYDPTKDLYDLYIEMTGKQNKYPFSEIVRLDIGVLKNPLLYRIYNSSLISYLKNHYK
jgi:hypothetical protein